MDNCNDPGLLAKWFSEKDMETAGHEVGDEKVARQLRPVVMCQEKQQAGKQQKCEFIARSAQVWPAQALGLVHGLSFLPGCSYLV